MGDAQRWHQVGARYAGHGSRTDAASPHHERRRCAESRLGLTSASALDQIGEQRMAVRVVVRTQAVDDTDAVDVVPVLAHFPLAFYAANVDLDADQRPSLRREEIGRRVFG